MVHLPHLAANLMRWISSNAATRGVRVSFRAIQGRNGTDLQHASAGREVAQRELGSGEFFHRWDPCAWRRPLLKSTRPYHEDSQQG